GRRLRYLRSRHHPARGRTVGLCVRSARQPLRSGPPGLSAGVRQADLEAQRVKTKLPARPQRAAEEGQRAIPGAFRPDRIVLRTLDAARSDGVFVGEGVVCEITVKFRTDTAGFQLRFEFIDGSRSKERILRGPM